MCNEIKVSVIIPVYNVAKYLSLCIESVLSQSLKEIEIILVNDKSPDNSAKIIEEYQAKDKRIVYIEHEKNLGVGGARNTGLDVAKAEYIYFVDADDFLSTDAIQLLYGKMKKGTNVDVVIGGFIPIKDDAYKLYDINSIDIKKIIDPHYVYKKDKYLSDTNSMLMSFGTMPKENGILAPLWNKLYRKEIFSKYNINILEGVHTEDLATTPKLLLKAHKILLLADTGYFYRLRENSALSKNNINIAHVESLINSHIKSIKSVKDFFLEEKSFKQYKQVLSKLISSNLYQVVNNPNLNEKVKKEALAMFFDYCAKELREKYSLVDERLYGDICFYMLRSPNIKEQVAKRWMFFASLSLDKKILYFIRWIFVSPKYLFKK